MRDFELPGRSAVYAANGMAATSHPLASLAAVETLKRGGNAVDAAVTAGAVLCVVEPMSTGIGGDCFALVAPKGGPQVYGFNGSGRAPKAATTDWYRTRRVDEIGLNSAHSVTIPGAIDAWERLLARFGSISLADALKPAIKIAEEGFPVSPRVHWNWASVAGRLQHDVGASRHYLSGGFAPGVGEIFKTPALARTLKLIAGHGARAFYEGALADEMVRVLREKGGLHVAEDFATHHGDWVEPIRTRYRDHDVLEIPPAGQGITALIMLNMLERFSLVDRDPHGVARFHLETEASRLAYMIRDSYVADPDFANVPVDHLLSKNFAAELGSKIQEDHRIPDVGAGPRAKNDTIYLSVVDKDRNACSFINSLYYGFGSGICTPEGGIMLQNRGACFKIEPGHPNTIEGGKRPLHTIIPGMMMENGKVKLSFGVMGGDYQPVGQVHVLTNIVDFGMDVQKALDSPRVFHEMGVLTVERGVSAEVQAGLAKLGHRIKPTSAPLGGGQVVAIDWEKGVLIGGSEPRKDGCALGY